MSSLLNLKLSLYHEIKTVILPDFGYIGVIENESLEAVSGELNTYSFNHSDLAYASPPSGHVDSSLVKLYNNGSIIDDADYTVNYIEGRVTLNFSPSVLTADYQYYPIKVVDAFPVDEDYEESDLPLISLDFSEHNASDFAIGQQESFWDTTYYIDIFATNDTMRLQLLDRLSRGLRKWIPIIDFESQMPLTYNGIINTSFDYEAQFTKWIRMKDNPRCRIISTDSTSIKEKFRGLINCSFRDIY